MEYCPFCAADKERKIIASTPSSVAFYDGFPVSPGHVLIVPRRHVASFFDLTTEEQNDLFALANQVKVLLETKFHPDGYNLGINVGYAAG